MSGFEFCDVTFLLWYQVDEFSEDDEIQGPLDEMRHQDAAQFGWFNDLYVFDTGSAGVISGDLYNFSKNKNKVMDFVCIVSGVSRYALMEVMGLATSCQQPVDIYKCNPSQVKINGLQFSVHNKPKFERGNYHSSRLLSE